MTGFATAIMRTSDKLAGPWLKPRQMLSAQFDDELPFEMIPVLANANANVESFAVRSPSVGLFADQEIRLHGSPLKVGEAYDVERDVIARVGSRKTGSPWMEYRIYRAGRDDPAATILLNLASLKASYPDYAADAKAMYGENCDA